MARLDATFVRCAECRALNEPRAAFCSRCGASLRSSDGTGRRGPRFTTANLAMGGALLLSLLIVVTVFYAIVARALSPQNEIAPFADQKGIPATISTTPPTTTADPNAVANGATDTASTTTTLPALTIRPKATVSSSALKGTAIASFQATNLVDGDVTTPWQEGANGAGLGEWVRFEFTQPVELARLEILNGYQKDDERYLGNPRVRLVMVEYSSGATQLVELSDVRDPQIVNPTSEAVEWVKLAIVSVYPGDKWEDTALSEVRIYEKSD